MAASKRPKLPPAIEALRDSLGPVGLQLFDSILADYDLSAAPEKYFVLWAAAESAQTAAAAQAALNEAGSLRARGSGGPQHLVAAPELQIANAARASMLASLKALQLPGDAEDEAVIPLGAKYGRPMSRSESSKRANAARWGRAV